MLNVKLWSFSKKNNSTAVPTSSGSLDLSCLLKEGTGIIKPVLVLKAPDNVNFYDYNYAYIEEFNRYYFIYDYVSEQGLWRLYLDIDPLASNRTLIGNLNANIERASNVSARNNNVIDNQYIIGPNTTILKSLKLTTIGDFSLFPNKGGYFVVGVNNGESVTGAVAYYLLTFKAFYSVINSLMKLNPYSLEDSIASKTNPLQYINSIYWTPINNFPGYEPISSIVLFSNKNANDKVSITLNTQEWGQSYAAFDNEDNNYLGHVTYRQYALSLGSSGSDPIWLKATSYRYVLNIPYVGQIELPADIIAPYETTTLYLKYKTDLSNGETVVNICRSSGITEDLFNRQVIFSTNARLGVNVLYGERSSNLVDVLANATTSLFLASAPTISAPMRAIKPNETVVDTVNREVKTYGLTFGGYAPSFNAMGGATGVLSALGSFSSNTVTRGSSGSYANVIDGVYLTIYKKSIINSYDPDITGYPVYRDFVINNIPGFIKCSSVVIDFPITNYEKDLITNYLIGGFYYE